MKLNILLIFIFTATLLIIFSEAQNQNGKKLPNKGRTATKAPNKAKPATVLIKKSNQKPTRVAVPIKVPNKKKTNKKPPGKTQWIPYAMPMSSDIAIPEGYETEPGIVDYPSTGFNNFPSESDYNTNQDTNGKTKIKKGKYKSKSRHEDFDSFEEEFEYQKSKSDSYQ